MNWILAKRVSLKELLHWSNRVERHQAQLQNLYLTKKQQRGHPSQYSLHQCKKLFGITQVSKYAVLYIDFLPKCQCSYLVFQCEELHVSLNLKGILVIVLLPWKCLEWLELLIIFVDWINGESHVKVEDQANMNLLPKEMQKLPLIYV